MIVATKPQNVLHFRITELAACFASFLDDRHFNFNRLIFFLTQPLVRLNYYALPSMWMMWMVVVWSSICACCWCVEVYALATWSFIWDCQQHFRRYFRRNKKHKMSRRFRDLSWRCVLVDAVSATSNGVICEAYAWRWHVHAPLVIWTV